MARDCRIRVQGIAIVLLATIALLGVFVEGCFRREAIKGPNQPVPFSHAIHIENGVECDSCHGEVVAQDAHGLPTGETCLGCHEEDPDNSESLQRVVQAAGSAEGIAWTRVGRDVEDLIFSHVRHLESGGIECSQCHGDIAKATTARPAHVPTMDTCLACHTERGIDTTCETCHVSVREDVRPRSHDGPWKMTHAAAVREVGFDRTGSRCTLCHSEEDCASCHQDEKPADHNTHWRYGGHGTAVSIDRSRCKACHTVDYCERCHEETSPRSHRGGWAGAPAYGHCGYCHLPLSTATNCAVCHRDASSHLAAPTIPGNPAHVAATEEQCGSCHTPFKLQHIDNGDSCRACHR